MNLRSMTIAAALAAAAASPALAMGPHARSEAVQQRLQESRMYQYRDYDAGFWPGELVVGGAIGTAGAVAAAPFGYDPYYGRPYPGRW